MIDSNIFHISRKNVGKEILMTPVVYDDIDINGDITPIKRICTTTDPQRAIYSMTSVDYFEELRLRGIKWLEFYIYQPVVDDDYKLLTNEEINSKGYIFDSTLSLETWVLNSCTFKLTKKMKVSTDLNDRKLIPYNEYFHGDEMLAILFTKVEYEKL